MAKQILIPELAQIVATLIANPDALGELNEMSTYDRFLLSAAELVADYCGGIVNGLHDDDTPRPTSATTAR